MNEIIACLDQGFYGYDKTLCPKMSWGKGVYSAYRFQAIMRSHGRNQAGVDKGVMLLTRYNSSVLMSCSTSFLRHLGPPAYGWHHPQWLMEKYCLLACSS